LINKKLLICRAGGPFAILLTYLSEFNSRQHRARAVMLVALYTSVAYVALPGSICSVSCICPWTKLFLTLC